MNFEKLKDKIVSAGKIAFLRIRKAHPNDKFYFFGLYSSGEFSYLLPTCSSHEGLKEVAQIYKKDKHYAHQSLENVMADLKWSPCDSPLHLKAEDEFYCLENDMNQLSAQLDSLYNPDDWSAFNLFVQQIENCILGALSELDKLGVFGTEQERKKVLINFVMGDQSNEERIFFAKKLNSLSQIESFVNEL